MAVTYVNLHISYLGEGQGKVHHDHYKEKYEIGGLCCSWAMDWVKKKLANKPLTAQTYENKARIKKIAKRHRLQARGGTAAVATAYSLRQGERAYYWITNMFDGDREVGQLDAGTYYYVSASATGDMDHGFAVYGGNPILLADAYSGVYQCAGGTCLEVVKDHIGKVAAAYGSSLNRIEAFPLTLR